MSTVKKLPVSEVFYSIQGEGQTMGIPAVFLRLGGCNILCQSESWICDTIEVWRKSKALPFEEVLGEEYEKLLLNHKVHLVVTGGEPLIHQRMIVEFFNYFFEKHRVYPIIEVETNATIEPSEDLIGWVDYWNVSPKLSNAGAQNTKQVRINPKALNLFKSKFASTIFKFVIEKESDFDEVIEDYGHHISMDQVVLMPAGSSQEELLRTRLLVAELCRKNQLRYSERLHVVIWNQKTGV
jgi:organic radical activating enzyme